MTTKRIVIKFDGSSNGTLECEGYKSFPCLGRANTSYKTDVTVKGILNEDKFPIRYSVEYKVDLNWVIIMDGNKGYWIHEGDTGRDASAGCINLSSGDAKKVYDWVDGRTRIVIFAPWLKSKKKEVEHSKTSDIKP